MVQYATRGSVDVGPRVLGLSVFSQDAGSNFVGLLHELDGWAGQQIWSLVTELLEGDEPGVGAPQDAMPVSTIKNQRQIQWRLEANEAA